MTRFKGQLPMQDKSLFISAGHSMSDPGASGNGVTEADIVLYFRDLLVEYLEGNGIEVGRDGRKGENLPLRQACEMAEQYDVAIEFHCNAFSDPSATGVETLSSSLDKPLGERISSCIGRTLDISNRGAKGEGSGQHSRLAFVQHGGIIAELFFLTNPRDLDQFGTNEDLLVERLGNLLIEEVTV